MKTIKGDLIIDHIYIGEHVEEIAFHLCNWLLENIKNGITPKIFKRRWDYFYWETDNLSTKTIPGITKVKEYELYWKDELDLDHPDYFSIFYKNAYNKGTTEFIVFNNNSYISLVAIKGKPFPKDIGVFVLGKENVSTWTKMDTLEFLKSYFLEEKEPPK